MSDAKDLAAEWEVLENMSKGDPERPGQIFKVAHRHFTRYRRLGLMSDLDNAIQLGTEAVQLTSEDHPQRTQRLINLSIYWHDKYPGTDGQNVQGLQDSIKASREAIAALPETYPHRGTLLDRLSTKLTLLFMRTREISVIEESIQVQREAVDVTPTSNTKREVFLTNLASALVTRHQALGGIEDLDEAIQILREITAQTDRSSPYLLQRLGDFSTCLSVRYEARGEISDLEEAIKVVKEAIEATEEGSLERMSHLSNYGNLCGDHYLRTGNMSDLEEAISSLQEVVDRVQDDEVFMERHICLSSFAIQLSRRYRRIGTVSDLKKAIKLGRRACDLTPADDSQAKHFSNLAIILKHEYFRTDDQTVLDEAIRVQRDAVKTAYKNHPDAVVLLHNLAALLTTKSKVADSTVALEEALQLGRQVVDLTPKDHPNRATYLNTLARQLNNMSSKTGLLCHLEEAIQCGKEAVDLTEDAHPERANRLVNQGGLYGALFWKTNAPEDLNTAIEHYEAALYTPSVYEVPRIRAGKELLQYYAAIPDWTKAYEAAKTAMSLVPKLISRTTNNADRQDVLTQVYGLSCDAAAVALSADKGALAALRFLEQGRGMLASAVEETRSETLDLQRQHPELAERFKYLQGLTSSHGLPADSADSTIPFQRTKASAHSSEINAIGELGVLVDKIHQTPGFEDFLSTPSDSKIRGAASNGPIIVINTSEFRCDAILIERDQVWSTDLSRLTVKDIRSNTQQGNIASPRILEWLWNTIAEPVLDALGIRKPSSEERLPRIWWIPTGVLSIYPLHAAGRHFKGSSDTVIDRAMSSYSSSIKVIIRSRGRATLSAVPSGIERAVLVSMETTPESSSLPSAGREIQVLRGICKSKGFETIEPRSIKEDVVSQLPQCKIFHFAGHGSTNGRDASQSSLLLQDWQKNPLTVSTLLDIDIQQYSPFLAYLSACGTGQIGHEKYLDESIHLISAFQLAGFRHVIGTLWEVGDEISVDIARTVYESIRRGAQADESICRGLYKATLEQRDKWFTEKSKTRSRKRKARSPLEDGSGINSSRDVIAVEDDEEDISLPQWIPYVHYGV
ncbi:CHAT domain-containing protein [Fusarium acuminatum]|uniref:CHAT domain-containing protein n=1 Tax=Fusarium acuminatum TaxID=5515 RepID=A0ABZ2WKM4_9HYPO